MSHKRIVLVEPVCRGSRLHWLWLVTKSLQDKYIVTILVREDYKSVHFDELMLNLSFELIVVPCDFNGEWLPRISVPQWWACLKKLREFDRLQDCSYLVFFMALDDYLVSFFLLGWSHLFFRKIDRVWTVKYRVECLTAPITNLRQWLIGMVMRLSCRSWKINSIVLDERLNDLSVGGAQVSWLPDPWFGSFLPDCRAEAREKYPFETDDYVALLIGRQDDRKGFPFMLQALPKALDTIADLKICVCGKIDKSLQFEFKRLMDRYGVERIHHDSEFISEEDLPHAYAMASVVLMPYAPYFTSTSGVLPRASASGVPVAASDHGLVGDRVRRYPLGTTFKYGDVVAFVAALKELRQSASSEEIHKGCATFTKSCSEEAFGAAVRELI